MSKNVEKSEKMSRLYHLKLAGLSDIQISKLLNISNDTVGRWRKSPEYQELLTRSTQETSDFLVSIETLQVYIVRFVREQLDLFNEHNTDLRGIKDLSERIKLMNSLSKYCQVSMLVEK